MAGPAEIAHGPMFIGFMFNVFLLGIMVTQVYLYFTTYKNDKTWMKIFVLVLLTADTANTIFDFTYLYQSLIIHFGDIEALATADWLFATDPAITGIIASLVQLFFAWRIRILTHSWPLAVVVLLGSLSGVAGAVATSFEVVRTPRFTDFREFKGVVIVWLVSESVTDIIITTSLVWYFNAIKRASKSRIIWLTVSSATGLITSIVATLDLILFLVYPNGIHLIFNFPLCKLYTNSLMSSLNARAGWRYGGSSARGTAIELNSDDSDFRSQAHLHTTGNMLHTGSTPASASAALVHSMSMADIGATPLNGTLLAHREHVRRASARSLGTGEGGGGGIMGAPMKSLSAGFTTPLARPPSTTSYKPRPEVYMHVGVDVESSRQLERIDRGRGASRGGAIVASRSADPSGVLRRGSGGLGAGMTRAQTQMQTQTQTGFAGGRALSVCLSVGTANSSSEGSDSTGKRVLEDLERERGPEASAEDLMRELGLDLEGVISPSELEAGRGRLS